MNIAHILLVINFFALDKANQIESGWTKEETDYLFELIKDYDMRWVVIADRYDATKYPNRTIEVLDPFFYMYDVLIHTHRI